MSRVLRIFVEGSAKNASDFRTAWGKFFRRHLESLIQEGYVDSITATPGGSGSDTFKLFATSQNRNSGDISVLLIDSERPLGRETVWEVVKQIAGKDAQRPDWATDQHLYLMVQATEAWLLADHEALERYFGRDFQCGRLPGGVLESRSVKELTDALEHASRNCGQKRYSHGAAVKIIEHVEPTKVRSKTKHGERFFSGIDRLVKGYCRN